MIEFNSLGLEMHVLYMGKRKPKPVRHELPGSIFLFLLRKNQSPLLPTLSFTYSLTDKSVFDEKKIITSTVSALVSR